MTFTRSPQWSGRCCDRTVGVASLFSTLEFEGTTEVIRHDEGNGPMNIVFFCQSCGARFEVDPRMAGKKGHCKKCGQFMSIPRARADRVDGRDAGAGAAASGAGAVAGASTAMRDLARRG